VLIDLHCHTRRYSWDASLSPDELIEMAKKAGLDGLCLSEHDYFWDPEDVKALAKKHDFLVLPAIEINTDGGHALCYGLTTYVYGMHRPVELAGHIQRAGGAMIGAHPYRRQMPWHPEKPDEYQEALAKAAQNPLYAGCDALEELNGRGTAVENAFSSRLIEYMHMPSTAGTDSHDPPDVAKCATEFLDRIEDLDGLIAALKAGRVRPVDLRMAPRIETRS
jgi:predicted metal-dependent phosphoesterase TrpH